LSALGVLRLLARLAALAPAFVLGLPVQALLVRLDHPYARHLPVFFHRYLCRVLGIRRIVTGVVPAPGPLLIVANHISWLDILVIGASLPVSFIAKSEVAGWPGAGLLARLQRTLFVDRSRRQAAGAASAGMTGRLAGGEALVLFAEGTTSDGNRVLGFRPALLSAAATAAAPVQPLALAYTRRDGVPLDRRTLPAIAWYGDMDLAPHLLGVLAGGPVDAALHFAAPVDPGPAGARKQLAATAETAVRTEAARLRGHGGV